MNLVLVQGFDSKGEVVFENVTSDEANENVFIHGACLQALKKEKGIVRFVVDIAIGE